MTFYLIPSYHVKHVNASHHTYNESLNIFIVRLHFALFIIQAIEMSFYSKLDKKFLNLNNFQLTANGKRIVLLVIQLQQDEKREEKNISLSLTFGKLTL